jgi:hypothetical protein
VGTVRLADIAKEITSKNAGNYFLTLDIIFPDRATYERVKQARVLTRASVAALYGVAEAHILRVIEYEPGNAMKVTMRRPRVSGDPGESDVFGAQQYAPLLDVEVPWEASR